MDSVSSAGKRPQFRFRRRLPPADGLMVQRQLKAAALAYRTFGSMEIARCFMNEPNKALGGRPIDVAGASEEGCRSVLDRIEHDAARVSGG